MTESASVVHKKGFFDTIWARLFAALLAAGGIALFFATNEVSLPGSDTAGAGNAGYRQCLDERLAAVQNMAKEAGYTAKQKELATVRAAETCRNLGAAQ